MGLRLPQGQISGRKEPFQKNISQGMIQIRRQGVDYMLKLFGQFVYHTHAPLFSFVERGAFTAALRR